MTESPSLLQVSTDVAVGVDLGQSRDPTSIAVVERIAWEPRIGIAKASLAAAYAEQRTRPPQYNLRALDQAPLGEPYPLQAQRVKRMLAVGRIAEADPRVYVDYTGVGRAVYEIFRDQHVPNLSPVTITFGGDVTAHASGFSVPKLVLISRLQALMHTGCLKMPDSLPLAKVLRRELLDFRVGYTAVGNATFGAREGAHDDLVLAVALAVFGLDRDRVPDASRVLSWQLGGTAGRSG